MKTTQIRLHKFLIEWLAANSEFSYTVPEIKRNIVEYGVLVSGVLTRNQLEWVYPSQTIVLNSWPTRIKGDLSKIKIVYQDEFCMVLNKPKGLVVEPGAGHPNDNVVTWLTDNYPEQNFRKIYGDNIEEIDESEKYYDDSDEESRFNERAWAKMTGYRPKKAASNAHLVVGKMQREHQYNIYLRQEKIQSRPYTFGALVDGQMDVQTQDYREIIPISGLVHRLDKDTQGLLLVAKDLKSFRFFQDQFRTRAVTKKYLAIVDGIVDQQIQIENWQIRSLSNPIEQKFFWTKPEAMVYSKEARRAESIIQPIAICKETNQSLIQVQIKTGRMHQIRVQCLAMGFPLTKDKMYNLNGKISENLEVEKAIVVNSPPWRGGSEADGVVALSNNKQENLNNTAHNGAARVATTNHTNLSHTGTGSLAPLKMTTLDLPKQFYTNPNNSASELINPIQELSEQEFQAKQKALFGEGDYCLLSNHLELALPNGKLIKFVVNELE
jgi:23S rRNA-/tRNA-specific pseudouridylate synthase